MPVTINVNHLSLVHKGSNGMTAATLPDVCKTPSPGGPVPLPYPNISFSSSLSNGTITVKADGGNMIAIQKSQFSTSIGDEPGCLGGVVSGTFKKEAKWLSWSSDVKMEGQGACRLTDKMTCNHGNTVSLGGEIQAWIALLLPGNERTVLCEIICFCETKGKQACVEQSLLALDLGLGGQSTMEPEVPYNMLVTPPQPMMSTINPRRGSKNWFRPNHPARPTGFIPGKGHVRRPDVVVRVDPSLPPSGKNLSAVVEIKFPPDPWDSDEMLKRAADYQRIASENNPDAKYIELDPKKCNCPTQKKRKPKEVPVPQPLPLPKPVNEPDWGKVGQGVQALVAGLALAAAGYALSAASSAGTGWLIANDTTGVGVADDFLIPVTVAGALEGRAIGGRGLAGVSSGFSQIVSGFVSP